MDEARFETVSTRLMGRPRRQICSGSATAIETSGHANLKDAPPLRVIARGAPLRFFVVAGRRVAALAGVG
jgi:hypothetical protein